MGWREVLPVEESGFVQPWAGAFWRVAVLFTGPRDVCGSVGLPDSRAFTF